MAHPARFTLQAGPYPSGTTVALRYSADGAHRFFARNLLNIQVVLISGIGLLGAMTIAGAAHRALHNRAAGIVAVAVLLALLFRGVRMAAIIEDQRLIVRNLIWTYRIPRTDIEEIQPPGGSAGRLWRAGVTIRRRDGSVVSISAFAMTPLDSPVQGAGYLLAAELADWVHTGGYTPAPDASGLRPLSAGPAARRTSWRVVHLLVYCWLIGVITPLAISAALDPTSFLPTN